jgi:GTP cyclohydrolase II
MLRLFQGKQAQLTKSTLSGNKRALATIEGEVALQSVTRSGREYGFINEAAVEPTDIEMKLESSTIKAADGEYCAFFNKSKHTEFDFLSNFHEHPVTSLQHGTFQCAEGLYQFQKFAYLNDASLKQQFMSATGQVAWNLSRQLAAKTDPQWNRVAAMQLTLRCKFADADLKRYLLETKAAYLVENSPNGHDKFWADNGNGEGENTLGILLMQLRQELSGQGVVPRPAILDLFYSRKCDHCTNCSHFTNKGKFYNFCDTHMTKELKLGNFSMQIHLSDIPDGTGRFLYFKTNDNDGLINEGTRLIVERIQALGLANPFFVTPEASTTSIAHDLRTKYGIDGLIIKKTPSANNIESTSVEYVAITSNDKKKLYIDKKQVEAMAGKDLIFIDNVCTTGETLRALFKLLLKAGVNCNKIAEAIVLFTEGEDLLSIKISQDVELKLHRFSHLSMFPTDPSVDKSRYRLYSAATIPTLHGMHTLAVFQEKTGSSERDAIVFYSPKTFINGKKDIPLRVHDACATSELFDSLKCDCKLQLDLAKKYIAEHGGMLIYLNQEGRGIGLGNKMAAYHLQQTRGLDTVAANRALGLPDDVREYDAVRDILNSFRIESIKLITNNPRKVDGLKQLGITVSGTIPCIVKPQSPQMLFYMQTKAAQMGHSIPNIAQPDSHDSIASSSAMSTEYRKKLRK